MWRRLEASTSDSTLTYDDIPWPPSKRSGGGGGGGETSAWKVGDLASAAVTLIPTGASKKDSKRHVTRWHPDKFSQRFGERLAEGDRARVMERVKATSQAINVRWGQLKS